MKGEQKVFTINTMDKSPLYRQIMDQMVLFAAKGLLENGDKLPSIRELASELGINPNTVARAYNELEQRGLIVTIPKKGAFVADVPLQERLEKRAAADFSEVYERYRQLGMEAEMIRMIAKEAFDDAEYSRSE